MDQYFIREINENELEICAEVISRSFMTVANEFELTKENCSTNGAFITVDRLISKHSQGVLMFGLFKDDKMVGYAELEEKDKQTVELGKLAVLPQYRHKGYGLTLLEYLKEKAKLKGYNRIIIGVIDKNIILKNWYLKYGFIEKEKRQFTTLPFIVCFMELLLNTP